MAATFRQIVNNVLGNIGETQIPSGNTTVTDTYQLQVCNFVNHIKEECEDAARWRALWQTISMTYPITLTSQLIKDAVTNATPNSRSKLIRMMNPRFGREVGLVFDTTSFGIPFCMGEMPMADLIYYNSVLSQTPVAYSTNYAIDDLGNDVVNLLVYPAANTQRTIQLTMGIPQSRIDATVAGSANYPWLGTVGLDTPILIPNKPIELGSTWFAFQERGEELGTSSMFTEERYRNALDSAVSRDEAEQGDLQLVVA